MSGLLKGWFDGVVDVILAQEIESLAETTVELLAGVTARETNGEPVQRLLPFEMYTPEVRIATPRRKCRNSHRHVVGRRTPAVRSHVTSAPQKKADLFEEAAGSRLMLQEQMVSTGQGNETGAGDAGGQLASRLERNHLVVPHVHDERRRRGGQRRIQRHRQAGARPADYS